MAGMGLSTKIMRQSLRWSSLKHALREGTSNVVAPLGCVMIRRLNPAATENNPEVVQNLAELNY